MSSAVQTLIYWFNQRQQVVLLDTDNAGSPTRRLRYQLVYAKDLIVHRGVDNVLEFAFVNTEQKPTSIKNKEITCRLISPEGDRVILQKSLTHTLPVTGITTLQLSPAEIELITEQHCHFSLEIAVGSFDYPVFVDSKASARGVIRVVDSVLPSFVPAQTVTIPSHPVSKPGQPQTYYSSTVSTDESPVLTFQPFFERFTGEISIEGSTLQDFSIFYPITETSVYTAFTGTDGFTITGYHPFVRIKIINRGTGPVDTTGKYSGDIVKLLAR